MKKSATCIRHAMEGLLWLSLLALLLIPFGAAHPVSGSTFDAEGSASRVRVLMDHDKLNDSDSDGLPDNVELALGTNPTTADGDRDGMADGWEVWNNLDPLDPADAYTDLDADGLSNIEEYRIGTLPYERDSDGDQFWDSIEFALHINAHSADAYPIADLFGDVNIDGRLDATDVQLAINGALNLTVPVPVNVNLAGGVNAADIQIIINAVLFA